jgi:hypothetical protein
MDASSAILLHKGGLLHDATAVYRVAVSPSVAAEVTAPGHVGSETLGRMLARGAIAVVAPPLSPEALPVGLHAGERDILALFQAGHGDFVLIDDGKAAAFCRDTGIPYLNALLLPRVLSLAGRISRDTCLKATTTITDAGRYAEWVIRYARDAENAVLTPFLPSAIVFQHPAKGAAAILP